MNEKDKIIVADVLDVVVSQVSGLSVAWGLSKALLGAGLKLRQQKALEWVEMVRDNPSVFTEQILEQVEFQDAFVYTLEKFIRERNENKRQAIKRIFLGYIGAADPVLFELERLVSVISTISTEAIELLSYIEREILPEMRAEYEEHNGQIIERLSVKVEERLGDQKGDHHDTNQLRDTVAELINLGIFRSWTESYNSIGGGGSDMHYNLSIFGRQFLTYVKN